MAAAEPPREVRKVVTVVFCDLTGSTALGDRTDPEALRATMRSYYDEMRSILERHGGTVEKFVGDAVMAVFGVPVAHEDDALRAVRAAWEMRAAVPALGLAARIGVNTGEVVAGEGDTFVTGDAVNVAARLEQATEPGHVLIGAETRRLVRDAVSVEPVSVEAKGKGTVDAFRVRELDPAAPAIARHLDTPLVGREGELDALRRAAERSVRESSCHLFTLLGAAGVGKSRLAAEFLAGVDAEVLRGRCLDYGEGITFWPVVEALKQLGPRADAAIERLTAGAASPNELFFAIRRLLEEVAHEQPLVVLFEDIHWGEPTFLDLIDHVADLSRGAPLLLICLARPELLDERPGWGGGKLNATTLLLEPLTAGETARLLEELDGGIDDDRRARIIQAADGNPLFAEEMLALAREGGDIGVPSTIQALLQARLDRLGADERTVIERGAVEGEVFHRSVVRELAPEAVRGAVEAHLVGLVRKELIRPDRATIPDDDAFRFRHLLIRDAAYEALPKETRADLHERFAGWLEARVELVELDEIVGYHLEQAALYRRELGRGDAALAARAGERLLRAGHAALDRTDIPAAINLLERGRALAADGADRAWAGLALAEAFTARQELARARELAAEATASPDGRLRAHAELQLMAIRLHSEPALALEDARGLVAELVPKLAAAADDAGLALAYLIQGELHHFASEGGPATEALLRALDHAGRAGAQRTIASAAFDLASVTCWGPAPVDEMERIAEDLERTYPEAVAPRTTATAIRGFAGFLRGDSAKASSAVDELRAAGEGYGVDNFIRAAAMIESRIALRRGRPAEAADVLRPTVERLRRAGSVGFGSTFVLHLAWASYLAGSADDVLALVDEGERVGSPGDVINVLLAAGLRARLAADRGDIEAARSYADAAVRQADMTDFLTEIGDAYMVRAYVERVAECPSAARTAMETARGAYEGKGDAVMVSKVDELLARLTPPMSPATG